MLRAAVAIITFTLFIAASGLHLSSGDLDPFDDLNEAEFEELFHEQPAADPAEEKRREEALLEHEEIVKETNAAFLAGNLSWFDALNEYSNIPEEEFEKIRTGALVHDFGQGLLHPPPEQRIDGASERFFDHFRQNPVDVPASYSSVDLGLVSPVKNQMQCGSCTSFASMAAVEICYRKLTGIMGDYSEQQFLDCAYNNVDAFGCDGAYIYAYFNWVTKTQTMLASEEQYPYLYESPNLSCPPFMPTFNQGAKINSTYYTYEATEELLKQLVYTFGAAVTTVKGAGAFRDYKGGVFAGCTTGLQTSHAVAVVGYGTTAQGEDYWLVKNSWGENWGENGYIRLKRGVNMCGIGQIASIITCGPSEGPTDPPPPEPCMDKASYCPDMMGYCDQPVTADTCPYTCQKC